MHVLARRAVAREASEGWWAVKVSNLRPSACKADALPTELTAHSCRLCLRLPARCRPASRAGARPLAQALATLLLPPDHTGPQTFAHNPMKSLGGATVQANYEIRFTAGDGPDA